MSEPPPPGVAGDAAVGPEPALTPAQVEAVLADFRAWLAALPAHPGPDAPAPESPGGEAGPDLFTLLSQFVALRHEVNLQTRAVRAQQEQSAETLRQLAEALDALREVQAAGEQARARAEDETLRPLLKTLVELYDALSVAGREAQRVQEAALSALEAAAAGEANGPGAEPPELPPAPRSSALARWLGVRRRGAAYEAFRARWESWRKQEADARGARGRQAREGAGRARQLLTSLVAGYTMSLQRLERALRQHGLEPIPAAGEPFDPERMEAVEAVEGTGRPPGVVLDEVRRGYLRDGRVFRYAQVRVARS